MHTHDQDSDGKSISIMDFYGSDSTPILGMVHDMIKTYAANHSIIILTLHGLVNDLRSKTEKPENIISTLESFVLPRCQNDGFPDIADSIKSMLQKVKLNLLKPEEFEGELIFIRKTASREAEKMMLFLVEPTGLERYDNDELFGSLVASKFPADVIRDLKESGTCYALRQPTACVLHLMRALEGALKAFAAKTPGYSFALKDTMNDVAKKVKTLAFNYQPNTDAEIAIKQKLSDAALHFQTIATALRNTAMHTGIFFTMKEANTALVSAEQFMLDLTTVM